MTGLILAHFTLLCGHITEQVEAVSDRKDGWYSARRCAQCNRKRAVESATFRLEADIVSGWARSESNALRHSQRVYSPPRLSNSGARPGGSMLPGRRQT